MFNFLKKKDNTIDNGERITITLYHGTNHYEAEALRKYLEAHKGTDKYIPVRDSEASEVYLKVEDVMFEEASEIFTNEMRYTVKLKGVICNE